MTQSIRNAVAGMLFALLSLGAQATAYDFGILSLGDGRSSAEPQFGGAGFVVGAFSDTWAFQLADDGSTLTSALSVNFSSFFHVSSGQYAIYSGTVGGEAEKLDSWTFGGTPEYNLVSLMSAGPYYLAVSGLADGSAGGHYVLNIAAPVPEPETYALLLAGLALVGFVARRRKGISPAQAAA